MWRWCVLLFLVAALYAQRRTGELRLSVVDSTGVGIEVAGSLLSQAIQINQTFTTDNQGRHVVRNLPFGLYRLNIDRPGFGPFSTLLEIRSEVPLDYTVTLRVAPIETSVVVNDSATLLDTHHTAPAYYIGDEALRDRLSSGPGRAVLDLIDMQPGWLIEANGVLHPRGAEYSTQYVVDGFPIVDNRSPAFAPGLEVDEIQSMNVRTAGYPAEYGRKLGGVIEVTTAEDTRAGWHGSAVLEGGSFSTSSGHVSEQYARGSTLAAVSLDSAHTERYLDPPVEQNYTNKASGGGGSARFGTDWKEKSRLRASISYRRGAFLVPDERLQYEAGQRQDRRNGETTGQISYQQTISSWLLASARAMVRDLSSDFWSNPQSTPMLANQQRGFRESYFSGALSAHRGAHELKAGGEAIWTGVHEDFAYHITDASFFSPDVPVAFQFADRRRGQEQSAFIQDLIQAGRWTFNAGLRWDRYRLLVRDSAVSPRLGAAWHWPRAGVVLRASYDRAFEIPAIENLLLASSAAAQHLTGTGTGLPVRPSRGNFYEAGLGKALFGHVRLEVSYFERRIRDFADDDLLLNTGVSFPIAFASAEIHGVEAKLEVPRWGPVSGFISYSNMTGTGRLPITGGLFLEENAAEMLRSTASFPITQDQRNTAHARIRYQLTPRIWAAIGANYSSGLPIELQGDVDINGLTALYGNRVVRRVNFDRGRVRPSFSLDASAGVDLWKRDRRSLRLQGDVVNLTNRLNVIDFAGIFSGTALATPRMIAVRVQAGW
ncbi:MAG: TonB-dependent receptor [Bryobacterales bacterium]|nr:TonB-dependent receptor [Bryobacterales bacterium]